VVINSTQFIHFCISFKTESPINGSTKLKIKFSIVDDAVTKASHKLKDFLFVYPYESLLPYKSIQNQNQFCHSKESSS